jgi:peptidoglycan/LPS O-acetylase OafA/YrhL
MIVLVIVSPGLAVVGLIAVIVLIACAVSYLIDRVRRRRRTRPPTAARRPPSRHPPARRPPSRTARRPPRA